MPTIARFGKVLVQVYGGEHGVPHFHVVSPEGRASVAIGTTLVLAGDLRAHEMRAALAGAAANRDLLMAAWLEHNG
jgi:hypothetical protein